MSPDTILLLYDMDYVQANTVTEHVDAFTRHSTFPVVAVNVHPAWKHAEQNHGPSAPAAAAVLDTVRKGGFSAVILHYTLFGMDLYYFGEPLLAWLKDFRGLKAAFFQDEYCECPRRFRFIDGYGVDMVYTLVEPRFFRDTYATRTHAPFLRHTIPGFVSERLLAAAARWAGEWDARDIDVGYRGHELDILYGLAGQEKRLIGQEFKRLAAGEGLRLDIETSVDKRIYGEDWHRFIGRCKAVLGVEAGVSIFDLDGSIRQEARALRLACPDMDDQELWRRMIAPHEDKLPHRTISPRHFEAAALGAAQILFEGRYSGVLLPDVHYIELKKDFSNLDAVLAQLRDRGRLQEITDAARRDLVDSGRWTYAAFIRQFDEDLRRMGLRSR